MKNDPRSCERNLCHCVKKLERTSTEFEPVTSRCRCYEATDVGSRSIAGSYVPVKEMSVGDFIYIIDIAH